MSHRNDVEDTLRKHKCHFRRSGPNQWDVSGWSMRYAYEELEGRGLTVDNRTEWRDLAAGCVGYRTAVWTIQPT